MDNEDEKSPDRTNFSHFLDRSCTPTHVIVQRQLDDVILSQKAAAERLKQETSLSLRDNYVSRDVYDQKVRQLEREREERYVPREDFENISRQLQKEKLENTKTQSELQDVTEKLEFALGQIEILTKQLDREKSAYQKSFSLLKVKTIKESTKNVALETKNSKIAKEKEKQEDVLENKEKEIQGLEHKLKAQDEIYKKQLSEMSVKLQQELYIAKSLGEKGRSKGEKIVKANVTKSKS